MEWTKEELIGTCILCTSNSQGKRIQEFYKKYGISNDRNWDDFFVGRLYGEDNGFFCVNENTAKNKIIKLPSKLRRKFPREMMVSDDKKRWEKRLVAGRIKSTSPYVSYIKEEFQEGQVFKFLLAWKYAKEIN